jgi:hypothetical protein
MIFDMLSQEVENSLNIGFDNTKDQVEFQKEANNYNLKNEWQARTIARLTKILKDTSKEKVDLQLQVKLFSSFILLIIS